MFNFKSILVGTSLIASIVSASPLEGASMSKLSRRQGIYVEDPFCDAFVDNGLTLDDLNTLRRVYTENFGTSGELPAGWTQAVCCSGACFTIQNLAGRTIGWNDGNFNEAYDAMIEEHGGGEFYGLCAAPTGDIYLVSSASRGACPGVDIYGDTCGGAPAFRGDTAGSGCA